MGLSDCQNSIRTRLNLITKARDQDAGKLHLKNVLNFLKFEMKLPID